MFRNSGLANREKSLALEFKERTATRCQLPGADDLPGWLFLMQLDRLPTRLLNWTESIVATTFFAVEQAEHHGKGALWGLNASALNKKHLGRDGLPVSDDAEVIPLFEAAFLESSSAGATKAAAVGTKEVDIRMLVQLSAFTILAKRPSGRSSH